MVLEVGLEPTRCLQRRILNPVRLPIPPLQHKLSSEHPVAHLTLTLQAFRDRPWLFVGRIITSLALLLNSSLFSTAKK